MRQLDEDKVLELMSSYRESGQINPISLDKELTLLAGHHRLEAARKLGWKTIDAKIFDADDLHKRLIEISENLIRNDLCYIGTAEHIVERENILTALGKRTKRGENRYTKTHDTESTEDLAKKMGTSSKMYRLQRQVGELRPEVRNSLRGTDYGKRSLNDLLHLAKQDDEVQKKVNERDWDTLLAFPPGSPDYSPIPPFTDYKIKDVTVKEQVLRPNPQSEGGSSDT